METQQQQSSALVEVRNLGKIYYPSPFWMRMLVRTAIQEPVVALEDITFAVHPGEICAVVGPNGAGKSTLFRILTGLTTPTSGTAQVIGRDASRESATVRRAIGFMSAEDRSLWLRHSCYENLAFHGRLQGIPKRELEPRILEILDRVGLAHARNRSGFALSSGMKARLQLARALLHRPSVLVLDEPTGAVDPVGSYELLQMIQEVTSEQGIAVLISSHRLEEIEALHDNVLLLDHGKIVYWGDLDTLRHNWEQPRIEIFFNDEQLALAAAERLRALPDVDLLAATPPSVTVQTGLPTGQILAVLNGQLQGVRSIRESKIALRDLLARLLKPGKDSTAEAQPEQETVS